MGFLKDPFADRGDFCPEGFLWENGLKNLKKLLRRGRKDAFTLNPPTRTHESHLVESKLQAGLIHSDALGQTKGFSPE